MDTELLTYVASIRRNTWQSVHDYEADDLAQYLASEPEEHFPRDAAGRITHHNLAMHTEFLHVCLNQRVNDCAQAVKKYMDDYQRGEMDANMGVYLPPNCNQGFDGLF